MALIKRRKNWNNWSSLIATDFAFDNERVRVPVFVIWTTREQLNCTLEPGQWNIQLSIERNWFWIRNRQTWINEKPCQSQDRSIWSTTKDARIKPNVKIKLILRRPRFDSCDLFLSAAPPMKGRRGVEEHLGRNYLYLFIHKISPSGSGLFDARG